MGWIDRLRGGGRKSIVSPLQTPGPENPMPYDTYGPAQVNLGYPYEPYNGIPGERHPSGLIVADPGVPLSWAYKGQVERVWKSQPNVRKVVDFIARSIAGIPLHVYERVSDTDRERVRDHPVATILGEPRAGVSPYRFWHSVMSDGLLYDAWAVWMMPADDGTIQLVQIPSWRLKLEVNALRIVESAWYWTGDQNKAAFAMTNDQWVELPLDQLIFDHGYSPTAAGLSPMITLADILAESAEAVHYRRQVWANGGRIPQYLHRPVNAPQWSKEARERFKQDFRAAYTGHGPRAGGIPLLQDGMELRSAGDAFKPQDTMDLEGRRLTAIEVASAFHIAPELVGAQQGNYSNVREYRQMLYRDSLGPYIQAWEQAVDTQLRRRLESSRPIYVEANVESKLRGSFEEQAAVMSTATGAPWMTRAEARAKQNLPFVDGTDELVVPLNVLVGGQASPRDSGDQNRTELAARPDSGRKATPRSVRMKDAPESYVQQAQELLSGFYAKQGRTVRSRIGAGDADWWDAARWDKELADKLLQLAVLVSSYIGEETAADLGFTPGDYDVDRTINYLKAVAERIATETNATTRDQVQAALDDDENEEKDPLKRVGHVFEVAEDSRAAQGGTALTTTFAGFAALEATRQTTGQTATKTWRVTSGNPRASHAAMDGETVGIDERFSNGLEYPGSIGGGPDETAGCQCALDINLP